VEHSFNYGDEVSHPLACQSVPPPTACTLSPSVTGTSVLGLEFKDGIILAADNLGMPILDSKFWIFT
jgi:hypothetical protein